MTRAETIKTIADSIPAEFLHGQSVHTLAAVVLYERLDVRTAEQALPWIDWAMGEARQGIESSALIG